MANARGMTIDRAQRRDGGTASAASHPNCLDCWLAPLCLPARLDPADLLLLHDIARPHGPMAPGQGLGPKANDCHQLFIVRSGCLRSTITTQDGQGHVVNFHPRGDVVSLDADFTREHGLEVVALERTAGCMISVDAIHRLRPQPSGLEEQIDRMMHREIRNSREHIVMMGCVGAQQRMSLFLQVWSQRMRTAGFSETDLPLPMTRADLASYLGLTTETVSRAISRLQANGAIELGRRRIEIRDRQWLVACAGYDIRTVAPLA